MSSSKSTVPNHSIRVLKISAMICGIISQGLIVALFLLNGVRHPVVFLLFELFFILTILQVIYYFRIHAQRVRSKAAADAQNDQMARLISQIEPHFLYNSITAIRMIDGNPQETKDALDNFARFLRGSFSSLDLTGPVPFYREMELVKQYLALEQLRFGERLKVEFDVEDEDFMLPAMSIEVLAENAVKHGIATRRRGGTLTIRSRFEYSDHVITVHDDGAGFDIEQFDWNDPAHYGLRSVRNRLSFQVDGTLELDSHPEEGTTVRLVIPDRPESVTFR